MIGFLALLAGPETRARRRKIRAQRHLQKRLYGYSQMSGTYPTIHLKRKGERWSTGSSNFWDFGPIVCRTDGRYRGSTDLTSVNCPLCLDYAGAGWTE